MKHDYSDVAEFYLDTRLSKAGYGFDFFNSLWSLDNSLTINWDIVNKKIHPEVLKGFRLTIARLAEEVSAHYTHNCWNYFRRYLLDTDIYDGGLITPELILNIKASLSKEDEYKLGTIRALLRSWISWGFNGLTIGVEEVLDKIVLAGNTKGKAVTHHCPYTGPYTLTEQQSLLVWAGNAFKSGLISLEAFAWFYTIYSTARRPNQIRALRAVDLTVKKGVDGLKYELEIPRAKQRGGEFRGESRLIYISEDMYLVLKNLTEQNKQAARKYIPKLTEEDLKELPIFFNINRLKVVNSLELFREKLKTTPDYLHASIKDVYTLTTSLSRKCDAISERTSDYIHFTPVRCRRTRATNLVRHGITGVQMAYLMDHSDTQQLKVYTAHTHELALRIFEHMNDPMTFLATKFEGRLIEDEREARRGQDIASRIYKGDNKQIGNCGGSPSCQAGMKACLLCDQFQPLLYAPWDELFLDLLEEVEQRHKEGASELVIKSYDLQLSRVKAILDACDKRIQMQEIRA